MAYTVHTNALAESLSIFGFGTADPDTGDCLYGWGEKQADARCPIHTTLRVTSIKDAAVVAKFLAERGKQVVVTDADDWSQIVNSADLPIIYLAEHQH